MADADSEGTETQVWLDFAQICNYLPHERYSQLTCGYEDVGENARCHDCYSGEVQDRIGRRRVNSRASSILSLPTASCILHTLVRKVKP